LITAPDRVLDEGGVFTILGRSDNGQSEFRVNIRVYIWRALPEFTPANSFIVSEPATRYKFKTVKGGGNEVLADVADVKIVWTTSIGALHHIQYKDGYIYFSTGGNKYNPGGNGRPEIPANFIEGNSLLAATDKDGNVLWSWHIWSVKDDEENATDGPEEAPVVLDGMEVMNRNLGAFAASDDSALDVWLSYGLFYQWGRKDPFVGPGEWNTSPPYKNTQQPLYDHRGQYFEHFFAVSSATTGTIEYASAHPSCFIAGAEESAFDWLFDARNDDLWAYAAISGTVLPKSIYDPCPAGWRVAPARIWQEFLDYDGSASYSDPSKFNVTGDYNHGWTFNTDGGTTFFAAAGRRSYSPSLASTERNYTNVVNDGQEPGGGQPEGYPVGFYWASYEPVIGGDLSVPKAPSLEFRRDYLYTHATSNRASGYPVRCVKE
jgi:hypothetical protein